MKLILQKSLTKTAFICRNTYCMEKPFLSIGTCVPLHFSSCLSLCPHATWFLSNLYFAPLHTDSLWCMLNAALDSKLTLSALFCPFVLKPATPAIRVCCESLTLDLNCSDLQDGKPGLLTTFVMIQPVIHLYIAYFYMHVNFWYQVFLF